ncbi:hypothetical protein CDLVIII_0023 [Clostridium sp. DL-VIII]|uniref:hypothetical protein n=1 Tax=Clostridium sp. DL-VIII TaxID=641107 RepID=UPI00023AF64D|nr:hypothetical protein [Clostridium sp. DL-VIII]EHI96766.1 hypothetical protein CDLVIII_0023 [Clostridium sp. DL-VIII]
MNDNENNSKKSIVAVDKLFYSIDNLLIEEKEQKLKLRLAKEIKRSIFTNEIVEKLNENDFSGLIYEGSKIEELFSSIFPIFVKKDNSIFRLYKHKIEIDSFDEMSDKYMYIFSDGRLTSGLFKCFTTSDDEYVYEIKKIIEIIPLFKNIILETLENFKNNIEIHRDKIEHSKSKEPLIESNYDELLRYLSKKVN